MASRPPRPQASWAESLCPALYPLPPHPVLVSARSGQSSRSPAQVPQGIGLLPPPTCCLSSSPPLALTPGAGSRDPKVLGDGSHNPGKGPQFPCSQRPGEQPGGGEKELEPWVLALALTLSCQVTLRPQFPDRQNGDPAPLVCDVCQTAYRRSKAHSSKDQKRVGLGTCHVDFAHLW